MTFRISALQKALYFSREKSCSYLTFRILVLIRIVLSDVVVGRILASTGAKYTTVIGWILCWLQADRRGV